MITKSSDHLKLISIDKIKIMYSQLYKTDLKSNTALLIKISILTAILWGGLLTSVKAQVPEGMKKDANDWRFTLGGGVGYFADYEGSDDYNIVPLPLVGISWRDTVSIGSVGGLGLNVKFLKIKGPTPKDNLILSAGIGYFGGRDQDDNDALNGLGDLEGGVTGKLSADYQHQSFGAKVSAVHDISGGRKGTSINAGLRYAFALGSPKTQLTLGSSVTWANDKYMENIFGISSIQATNSTLGYSAYSVASGFKDAGVNASVRHFMTQNIGIMGRIGYKQLLANAADSPIVDRQGNASQLSAIFGVSYNW